MGFELQDESRKAEAIREALDALKDEHSLVRLAGGNQTRREKCLGHGGSSDITKCGQFDMCMFISFSGLPPKLCLAVEPSRSLKQIQTDRGTNARAACASVI